MINGQYVNVPQKEKNKYQKIVKEIDVKQKHGVHQTIREPTTE